jgi:hypothetical protein
VSYPAAHDYKHGSRLRRRCHRAAGEANANLEPEILPAQEARELLEAYARAARLAAFGVTVLARRLKDASEVARATGTSLGRTKDTVATGEAVGFSPDLGEALRHGEISFDPAIKIATAERSGEGTGYAQELEEERRVKLEQLRGLEAEHDKRNGQTQAVELLEALPLLPAGLGRLWRKILRRRFVRHP